MLKSYGWWGGVVGWVVAYVIIVSAQVPLVLTLGLWTSGLGLTKISREYCDEKYTRTYYGKMDFTVGEDDIQDIVL